MSHQVGICPIKLESAPPRWNTFQYVEICHTILKSLICPTMKESVPPSSNNSNQVQISPTTLECSPLRTALATLKYEQNVGIQTFQANFG